MCISGGPIPQGPYQVTSLGWVSLQNHPLGKVVFLVGGMAGENAVEEKPAPWLGGVWTPVSCLPPELELMVPPPGAWAMEEVTALPYSCGSLGEPWPVLCLLGGRQAGQAAGQAWNADPHLAMPLPGRSVWGRSVQEERSRPDNPAQQLEAQLPMFSPAGSLPPCNTGVLLHAPSWLVVLRGPHWAA